VENLDENLPHHHHHENKMNHQVDQNEMVVDQEHPLKEIDYLIIEKK
jgi:hypothetical protein